jgi:transposase
VTRRANALVLLDDGWSCQEVADAFLLNDDTIRNWYKLFEQRGIEGLTSFDMGGSTGFLSPAQEDALKAFVGGTLPRSMREVGAFIERELGLVYESRSGPIALLDRLGFEYHKPNVIARKLDVAKQKNFIESHDKLLNSLGNDEAVLFVDAVHPTHAARPIGCWAPKQEKIAIAQTSGRERINIHGAINLETGQTRMIDVETVNAASTITLLEAIEALYPMLALIHVFLDNARYHHAKLVQEWLAGRIAGSSCISSRPIARISIRSSGYGGSCTETSPTTKPTKLAPNSPTRHSVSCAKKCPATGPTSAMRSQTTSVSSIQRIFGS